MPSLVDINALKNLLHQSGFSQIDKLLLCISFDVSAPKAVKTIKVIAKQAGFREAEKWNISSLLSRSGGLAIRTDGGWELTNSGKERVAQLAGTSLSSITPKVASSLRSHLAIIKDQETSAFLEEAIKCYETKLYRSAVVLTWVGAIAVLYEHVVTNRLADFNAEALSRNPKWKMAKTKDDLANLKEYDFLQILHAISVIGKSVKDELEGCLKYRNGCGHPNSLKIGESRVSGHIETLMLNVFSKF